MSPHSSSTDHSQYPDAPENYEILREIGSGSTSSVYLAICRRGRLKNRRVALKKIPLQRVGANASPHLHTSTALYHSLHHPTIVSLLASFSTPEAQYHVLELCENGTLAEYMHARHPPTLSEAEMRGVMKTLVESLQYARKMLVIHRDLKPSNVLLSEDYMPKLCDFGLATRLSSSTSTTDTFCGSPNYVAPEVVSRSPYSFAVDVWGLGALMVSCLSGEPPFEAPEVDEIFDQILHLDYILPETISYEAKDLVDSLLQLNPHDRLPLHRVLSHPFFNPALPTTPLGPSLKSRFSTIHSQLPPFPRLPSRLKTPWRSEVPPARQALGNIVNTDLRHLLRDDDPSTERETRRIVSEPLPRARRATSSSIQPPSRPPVSRMTSHATAPSLLVQSNSSVEEETTSSAIPSKPSALLVDATVGTTRPVPISMALLAIETHKSVHGSIAVLPSRSLLVDFREGERRKGKKGNQVFVVSGLEVLVYSAPHLSTPCCLAEPVGVHSLHDLPVIYWKQYNTAHHLLMQIKQRTPRLVLYQDETKCTLMANEPYGDIELLFQLSSQSKQASMRIRLSRERKAVHFARHIAPGEWTKKELAFVDDRRKLSMGVEESAWRGLTDEEREGIAKVLEFVGVCEAVEKVEGLKAVASTLPPPPPVKQHVVSDPTCRSRMPAVAPPPSKPQSKHRSSLMKNGLSVGRVFSEPGISALSAKVAKERSAFRYKCSSLAPLTPPTGDGTLQTRFIPSVGWCIRRAAGSRYSLMFMDGAVAEVDVEQEWVELAGRDGKAVRHAIRDCGNVRELGERMKVFEDFVSMFDDGED